MKAILSAVCAMLTVSILPGARPATWYVDGSVPRAGDGTSWENAFKKIQAGINKAADGDTVIVAQGTYVENINFNGKTITLTSTNPLDWEAVGKTIIDGNKAGSVVTFSGAEERTCVLSGFKITNGYALLGGGIWGGSATIRNNIILGNRAYGTGSAEGGGGISTCAGLLENNIIVGNTSPGTSGGGAQFCGGAVFRNCLIVGNSAEADGGVGWSTATFENCTISFNTAVVHGGGLAHGSPVIQNCVIWGNAAPQGPQLYDITATPGYCCIQGWAGGGQGNVAWNPQFVDPDGPDDDPDTYEDNNYHLLPTSVCIDAGINEDWMNGAVDLDGKPRILLGATSLTVDLGAYEYRFDLAIDKNAESNVELSWTMRPQTSYTVLSSFDLSTQPWVEETTILGGKTGGLASWLDPAASFALKFYKLEVK